jgi:hypothetical protein
VETLKNISFLKDETKRAKEVAQKTIMKVVCKNCVMLKVAKNIPNSILLSNCIQKRQNFSELNKFNLLSVVSDMESSSILLARKLVLK